MTLVLTLHVIVTTLMVCAILLQRGEGGGFVSSGKSLSDFLVKQVPDLLTKATVLLAGIFFITTLIVSIMMRTKLK